MKRLLRLGTRGSVLALAQANEVKRALEEKHPDVSVELVTLKTSGDVPKGDTLREGASPSGPLRIKGLFVKEIEEALLEGRIELAVHSVKDLQTDLPKGLQLAAVLPRQDPRDALVTKDGITLKELPAKSRVGVSSLRRQAQIQRLRRDLELLPIRGNVDTRLKKLDRGEYQAIVLAACGLIRLGLTHRISEFLNPEEVSPAPGQGALGIEVSETRQDISELLQAINDSNSYAEVSAERAFLRALGGSCDVPVGALARIKGGNVTLTGVVLSPDGRKSVKKQISGPTPSAEKLGAELASHIRAAGADRLLFGAWAEKVTGA